MLTGADFKQKKGISFHKYQSAVHFVRKSLQSVKWGRLGSSEAVEIKRNVNEKSPGEARMVKVTRLIHVSGIFSNDSLCQSNTLKVMSDRAAGP